MFHPYEWFLCPLFGHLGCFVMLPIQISGMVFTVSHRKREVTGVTDLGSEFGMWWSGTASINLSVILSRRWSLNTARHSGPAPLLHMVTAQPLGNSHSSPLFCLFLALHSFSSFYLNFTSCPFSVFYFSTPTLALREKEGEHAKRCGIFYRSWHPWRSVTRHFALSFTLFFPCQLSPFKLPYSTPSMKSHSRLPRKPVSLFPFLVCFFSRGSVYAFPWMKQYKWKSTFRNLNLERTGIRWKRNKGLNVGVGVYLLYVCVRMCVGDKDKIRSPYQPDLVDTIDKDFCRFQVILTGATSLEKHPGFPLHTNPA